MKAIDIANYIVCCANEKYCETPLTHLKLQKILYYVTTEFLKKNLEIEALYPERIEKWQFGPVVSDVYNEFKTYGGKPITSPTSEIIFSQDDLDFEIKDFDASSFEKENECLVAIAKEVIDKLIVKDAFTLVDMTHQEKAWLDSESKIKNGVRGLTYSSDELREANNII
ncbi:Panacea domain-containing protein [Acinetobacter sp. BY484]|uniref:Panacea domain-containing protein n=1 Tax=Acinetobacter sp. BY484 TaxID=2820674 RepID=UPI001C22FE56|nr:type II toxin-antitoxin system antitoxin SocA domain-containing protein [Acinetobacter sp. BY484]